jgi:hypothetical protein
MNPRALHPGRLLRAARWSRRAAAIGGSIFVAAIGFSAPSKPNQAPISATSSEKQPCALAESKLDAQQPQPMIGLGIGLAGPPLLSTDGAWWLLGRDGEIGHFRADDHLLWSVSIASTITGAAVSDAQGILYVPTARDLIYALEPSGHQRWRFRAPAGISGPLGLMAGQTIAFTGRDRALYWLDQRANLLLRASVGSRVSAGPVPFGSRAIVGTEAGDLVAMTRQGKRQSIQIGAPITVILPTRSGIVALVGDTAVGLDADLRILWSREKVLGIGVTSALGQAQSLGYPTLLYASGKLDWLDALGRTLATVTLGNSAPMDPMPEFAATDRCAWIACDSGALWEACVDKESKYIPLTRVSLTRPVLDAKGRRVMVGSAVGGLWSVPLASDP